jgi:membrane-bound ClpP family serine protease
MMLTFILILYGPGLIVIVLAAASRWKKSATRKLALVGASAIVEKVLAPEGSVLISGDLWPASSREGTIIARQSRVRVVGIREHFLIVEPW